MQSNKSSLKMSLEEVSAVLKLYKVKRTHERNKDDKGIIIRLKSALVSGVTITVYDTGTVLLQPNYNDPRTELIRHYLLKHKKQGLFG